MSMGPLRLLPRPMPFDWQQDEDGEFTTVDRDVALAVLDQHEHRPVRDVGRKLRRLLDEIGVR